MTLKTKSSEIFPKNDIKILEFTNIKIKRSCIHKLRGWNSDTVRNSWGGLSGYDFMCRPKLQGNTGYLKRGGIPYPRRSVGNDNLDHGGWKTGETGKGSLCLKTSKQQAWRTNYDKCFSTAVVAHDQLSPKGGKPQIRTNVSAQPEQILRFRAVLHTKPPT